PAPVGAAPAHPAEVPSAAPLTTGPGSGLGLGCRGLLGLGGGDRLEEAVNVLCLDCVEEPLELGVLAGRRECAFDREVCCGGRPLLTELVEPPPGPGIRGPVACGPRDRRHDDDGRDGRLEALAPGYLRSGP